MSQRNGDRSAFNRKRKAKIAQRERNRKLREEATKVTAEKGKKS